MDIRELCEINHCWAKVWNRLGHLFEKLQQWKAFVTTPWTEPGFSAEFGEELLTKLANNYSHVSHVCIYVYIYCIYIVCVLWPTIFTSLLSWRELEAQPWPRYFGQYPVWILPAHTKTFVKLRRVFKLSDFIQTRFLVNKTFCSKFVWQKDSQQFFFLTCAACASQTAQLHFHFLFLNSVLCSALCRNKHMQW